MSKEQQEIHGIENLPWAPVPGTPGIFEKILNRDPHTGSVTRLLRFEQGIRTTQVLSHDFYEEIYVLEGTLIDLQQNLTLNAGYYGYRHPGMNHGPYYVQERAITFEVRNYPNFSG